MIVFYFRYLIKEFIGFLILKSGLFRLILFLSKEEAKLIILNYHNFSKYNNYKFKRGSILQTDYSVNFEKQIIFLKRYLTFLDPINFHEGNIEKKINLYITFDDGYKDNFDIAFPILKKYNAKATFFIVTNIINSNNWLFHDKLRYLISTGLISQRIAEKYLKQMNSNIPLPKSIFNLVSNYKFPKNKRLMMNWHELFQIKSDIFKVQPHTHNHSILSFLNYEEQKKEIINSINSIELNLKNSTNYFAYPNGLYNNYTIDLLKSFNIKYAFTTIPGVNNMKTDTLQMKRIGVNVSDSIGVICLKIILNLKK